MSEWKKQALKPIKPVGEGLSFSDADQLARLYAPAQKAIATESHS
jgi:hypothetical protein